MKCTRQGAHRWAKRWIAAISRHGITLSFWVMGASCAVFQPAAWGQGAAPLPALGLDARGVSVSGLSSGGYMAAQFEVAYAKSLMGAGVVAGGPYGCSMGSVSTATFTCSCPYDGTDQTALLRLNCLHLPPRVLADRARHAIDHNQGHVDGLGSLREHRVWLYWGENDPIVDPSIVQGLALFYAGAKVAAVTKVAGPHAGHAMPTAEAGDCAITHSPYINGCRLDGAGALLRWIYKLPATQHPSTTQAASLKPFDQRPYRQAGVFDSMDDTGWLYVPRACERADAHCKLHVAFHGCEQGQHFIEGNGQPYGTAFVERAGYNRWAESAGVVVLYPQVVPTRQQTPGTAFGFNPKGCWDFWGYTTPPDDHWEFGSGLPFARREAPQMKAVKAMIDALLAAPSSLHPAAPSSMP